MPVFCPKLDLTHEVLRRLTSIAGEGPSFGSKLTSSTRPASVFREGRIIAAEKMRSEFVNSV